MRTLILSIFASAAFAQVGGPVIGYVPEGTQMRVMYGLPAAGSFGPLINAGRDFSRLAVSPRQTFAIATAADTGEVLIVKPGVSVTTVAATETNPDILAISPHGTSAVLWFPSTNHLEAISGLPDAASVRTIDASFLNASPLSIAISDDGQWAVGLWSSGVYAFGPSNQVIPLQTDAGVQAIAFFHNSHDLALATQNRATTIADVGGSMQPSILYDYSTQPLSPRAIGISFDNKTMVVAASTGTLLTIVNGSSTTIDCGCSPQGLYGLGRALFRLNGTAATTRSGSRTELKLFDATSGAVLIVPPALSLAGGRQ